MTTERFDQSAGCPQCYITRRDYAEFTDEGDDSPMGELCPPCASDADVVAFWRRRFTLDDAPIDLRALVHEGATLFVLSSFVACLRSMPVGDSRDFRVGADAWSVRREPDGDA